MLNKNKEKKRNGFPNPVIFVLPEHLISFNHHNLYKYFAPKMIVSLGSCTQLCGDCKILQETAKTRQIHPLQLAVVGFLIGQRQGRLTWLWRTIDNRFVFPEHAGSKSFTELPSLPSNYFLEDFEKKNFWQNQILKIRIFRMQNVALRGGVSFEMQSISNVLRNNVSDINPSDIFCIIIIQDRAKNSAISRPLQNFASEILNFAKFSLDNFRGRCFAES